MKTDYTREELIQICRDAVVHHTKWDNRDSYSAQINVQEAFRALTAGWDFSVCSEGLLTTNSSTIWITLTPVEGVDVYKDGEYLNISSRDEYFEDCDPEYNTEMFDNYGESFDGAFSSYLPTRERLDTTCGDDWY